MKKLISALLMLSALILSCKSNTQNQAQSPVNAGEATSAQAGTLTAYYAKEDSEHSSFLKPRPKR